MFADSHCHLQLIDYKKSDLDMDGLISNARENKVNHILCVATHLDQTEELHRIADKYDCVNVSVGLHPSEEIEHEPNLDDYAIAQAHPKVIAIGETGLDYFRTQKNARAQQDRFRVHIRAAKQCNKPLIVHTRKAKQDTLDILRDEDAGIAGGVLHCFTEDLDMAKQALDLNFYISFSGIVTFSNAVDLQEVALNIPLDRILIETDSPYLSPEPMRGKINQPANVRFVAEFIAKLKGLDVQDVAEQTTKNYKKLFKIKT